MTIYRGLPMESQVARPEEPWRRAAGPRVDSPRRFRRARPMAEKMEWVDLIGSVVRRWFQQHGRPSPDSSIVAGLATRLRELIDERGLPPPLPEGECGAPGGMSEAECSPLVLRVAGTQAEPLLAEATRQLVKACFYPEFSNCRDSFRQVSPDGSCRRQQLSRVRGRLSGAHCVDCPHWIRFSPAEHAEFLAAQWHDGATAFLSHRDIFLPEDFRALRRWLWSRARTGPEAA